MSMRRPNVRCCPNGAAAAAVPRAWPNSTVVCIGGGPSLTAADVAACRGRARVIGINDAYRIAPWADVLYAADASWWREHQGVPAFTGPKYCLQPEAAVWPGVQILQDTGRWGLELRRTGLRTGFNSGYQAINLAIHFGARRILLLGYDMQRRPGQPSHWFGEHPGRIRRDSPYHSFVQAFGLLPPLLAQLGVTVVNCSRETALTVFPRAPIAEALA